MPMTTAAQLLIVALAFATASGDDDIDVTKWEVKGGFIPGTKDDVEVGWMTVEKAKDRCAQLSECLAITYRGARDLETEAHIYLKRDSTVAENDKTWTSMVKRPAGLMDVNFINNLTFPLELCWIDMIGTASPVCYGTVQAGTSKNMTSFATHNFVLKRLVWSLTAAAAASTSVDGGALPITARQRAHEWEAPLFPLEAASQAADSTPTLDSFEVVNRLSQPAEICSAPRWASRLLQSSMPAGLETCHGVAPVGGKLMLKGISRDAVLLARQVRVLARPCRCCEGQMCSRVSGARARAPVAQMPRCLCCTVGHAQPLLTARR